ncbi:MAG: GlmU family protein [Bacteroidota bacterium]|nr:GlmU family protein [Bacteroidota bacterium]
MNLIFFDDSKTKQLYPLTYTRPAADLRCGILTVSKKWESRLQTKQSSYYTSKTLSKKFEAHTEEQNILINGRLLPNKQITEEIKQLKPGEFLCKGETVLSASVNKSQALQFKETLKPETIVETIADFSIINHSWDIFRLNGSEIENDFHLLTAGRKSQKISSTNRYLQPERIFIEKGAKLEFSTLNPAGGYIYIGRNAEIMENVSVRGALAMGENALIKMGAKIYGPTTLGEYCKVGGEVNNTVFHSYSNKGHDGFLGNAVIGQWCNMGADTNNSNLKNNYDQVKMWDYDQERFLRTGLQFCGLIMGDHTKTGINTMLNTGTVLGVSSNIYGPGFPRNFVPSFSWGGAAGFKEYNYKKALKTAEIMMARRTIDLDTTEQDILSNIFEETKKFRRF